FFISIVNTLYYFQPDFIFHVQEFEKNRKNIGSYLKQVPVAVKRYLNYYAYYFLSKKDDLAISLLIEFMNPEEESIRKSDANYSASWIYLNQLHNVLLSSSYEDYRKWWQTTKKPKILWNDQALVSIFQNIKNNEDRAYRIY
ncbi:MAG: hypothetical protein HYS98_02170, partial [Deltaproteobacteria bacterium]|nr:hypothetical protein [Deltaproteobacteria bacterium]